MSLPASLIREGVKDSTGGCAKTNSEPHSSGGLLHYDWKTFHKKALDILLFSWFGFEPDEKCYLNHNMPPTCATTILYNQRPPPTAANTEIGRASCRGR